MSGRSVPKRCRRSSTRGEEIVILDVRNPEEAEISRLAGSILIPLGELPERVAELNTADQLVVHCRMGGRSAKAVEFLRSVGFRKVKKPRGRHQRVGRGGGHGNVEVLRGYCSARCRDAITGSISCSHPTDRRTRNRGRPTEARNSSVSW